MANPLTYGNNDAIIPIKTLVFGTKNSNQPCQIQETLATSNYDIDDKDYWEKRFGPKLITLD
jgi:hypothetical protein